MKICRSNNTGFTLIEVLIALTLLSLIMLLIFSSLHAAGRNWETGSEQMEGSDEFRLASHFIRKKLNQTVPLIWINGRERKLAFVGKEDEINFVSTLPAHRGGGGLYLLTLKLKADEDNQQLILQYRMAIPERQTFEIDAADDRQTVVLAEDIEELEFSYFGNERADEPLEWRDEWEVEERLPLLVSLKVNATDQSRSWPEMLINVHAEVEKGQPQFYQMDPKQREKI